MIFTTNKPLAAWGRVLHVSPRPSSIGCSNGRHLELRGPSYRTRHVKLDRPHDLRPLSERPTRISGNHRPEFPEPTQELRRGEFTLHLPVLVAKVTVE